MTTPEELFKDMAGSIDTEKQQAEQALSVVPAHYESYAALEVHERLLAAHRLFMIFGGQEHASQPPEVSVEDMPGFPPNAFAAFSYCKDTGDPCHPARIYVGFVLRDGGYRRHTSYGAVSLRGATGANERTNVRIRLVPGLWIEEADITDKTLMVQLVDRGVAALYEEKITPPQSQ